MSSQNKVERPLNIPSIRNNLKSFIKQVYQKGCTHKFDKKRDKKIASEQKQVKGRKRYLHLKKESRLVFNNGQNLLVF